MRANRHRRQLAPLGGNRIAPRIGSIDRMRARPCSSSIPCMSQSNRPYRLNVPDDALVSPGDSRDDLDNDVVGDRRQTSIDRSADPPGIGWSSGPASAFSQAMSTVRGAKGRVSGDRGANSSNRRTFAPETTADLFKWLNQTDNIPCIVSQTGRTSGQLLNGRTTMAELVPLPKIRANGVDRPVRMRYLYDGPTISRAVSGADGDFSARRECAS